MKVFLLAALLLGFSVISARAQDCVPQAEMKTIADHFTQFASLADKEYCFNGSEESHLIAGIVFMRKTQFQTPMDRSKDGLFSGTFSSAWWDYFIGRINEFSIDTGCPKGVIAYVYMFGGNTMYVCSAAMTDNFTGLDLASVFMHEARHIDGYPHVTCDRGPRAGLQGACDTQISDTGSYAVTVETYAQLARYAVDIHPALKAYARSASVIYADEAFENPVQINRSQRFLVLANDKRFYGLNPNGNTQALGLAPELGHIVMRSQHLILVPDNKDDNARFVFVRGEGEVATQAGDQAAEYNALKPADRSSMVSIHISAQWNARVYKNKVRLDCDPHAHTTTELAISDVPVSILYPNGYDRAAKSALIQTESGKVYEMGCNGTTAQLQQSKNINFDQRYKSVYKVGDLVLGLTPSGYLRQIQGNSSKPFPMGKLDGSIHELALNQVVDFYQEN